MSVKCKSLVSLVLLSAFMMTGCAGWTAWKAGIVDNSKSSKTLVNVYAYDDKGITFDFSVDDGDLLLGEPENVTEGFLRAEVTESNKEDLHASIKDADIRIASNNTSNYKKLVFRIVAVDELDEDRAKIDNKVASENNLISLSDKKVRKESDYTYIDLVITEIALPEISNGSSDEYKQYTFETIDIGFKWGSFFEGKTPCTFYNEIYSDRANQTPTNAQAIESELTAMHDQLNYGKNGNQKLQV